MQCTNTACLHSPDIIERIASYDLPERSTYFLHTYNARLDSQPKNSLHSIHLSLLLYLSLILCLYSTLLSTHYVFKCVCVWSFLVLLIEIHLEDDHIHFMARGIRAHTHTHRAMDSFRSVKRPKNEMNYPNLPVSQPTSVIWEYLRLNRWLNVYTCVSFF